MRFFINSFSQTPKKEEEELLIDMRSSDHLDDV